MNKALRIFVTTILVVAGTCARAQDSGFYGGVSLGGLDLDFSDATLRSSTGTPVSAAALRLDFDQASLIGLSAGYHWGSWAVELQYLRNLGDPDMKVGTPRTKGTYDYEDYRLSGVYRSQGRLYFLGRAGISVADLDSHVQGARLRMGSAAFLGLGGGFRFTDDTSLELDASKTQDDTGMVSLTLRHQF